MAASREKINRDIEHGKSAPLGASFINGGVNFSLFSRHGKQVDLLLFDSVDDLLPSEIITLNRHVNKTYHYWHVQVNGIKAGQLYGYRVHGPNNPSAGHRFDKDKILLDPYSHAIAVPDGYNRKLSGQPGVVPTPSMKSVVVNLADYDWEGDEHPMHPFAKTIIYELHVSGFTSNPNSGVPKGRAGTYAGLIDKLPYLADLGITAIELLPVFQFDKQDSPEGKLNYWGYSPISFFAIHQHYGSNAHPCAVITEFRDMVKACHKAGIEVILDVVFNHTSEGKEDGPTYCFKGIDNRIYYTLESDRSRYANFSGTGNSLNANHSIVRRMIIDSLHHWVKEMHVDGFRFDLASILSRDQNGIMLENPPVLWDIESDPELAGIKLIAEAWDAAGLYQVGSFVGDSWKEWNGRFRDDLRGFMRGDHGRLPSLASRLMGSPDIYGHEEREPEQSINFVTCHDGFTLNDLVTYNQKHNEANGEDNQDGENENLSWNCGVEGWTDDPAIEGLRNRQVKNFLACTLLAIGTPMLLMGDEVRRTQKGNNNAYCQDNPLSWFDWQLLEKHPDIHRLVKIINHLRLTRDSTQKVYEMSLNEMLKKATIQWHGIKAHEPDWGHHSRTIAFTIVSLSGALIMHYILNAYDQPLAFEIPKGSDEHPYSWRLWIDSYQPSPADIYQWDEAPAYHDNTYLVQSHSMVILYAMAPSQNK